MGAGADRNKECWSGSGRKFKHCHLRQAGEPPIPIWEVSSALYKAFGNKTCLAPSAWHAECGADIIHAHTIPKSGSLKRIARQGHVYAIVPSIMELDKNTGRFPAKLIGLNQASTITGFCGIHDDRIFSPLEKKPFQIAPEHCLLLAFRAFAREQYTKLAGASQAPLMKQADRGRQAAEQTRVQIFSSWANEGFQQGVKDALHYRDYFDHLLLTGKYDDVRAYVLEFEQAPTVMCSAGFYPEQDFKGTALQNIADTQRVPDLLSVTSFFGDQCGVVAFVWLASNHATCLKFVESMAHIADENLTSALVQMFFEHFENVFMEPNWWEVLDPGRRDALLDRMVASIVPGADRKGALVPDGNKYGDWGLRGRTKLGW